MNTELVNLKSKYYPLPLALIKKIDYQCKVDKEKVIFTFAGRIYKDIRTPFPMLEFFKNIDFDYQIKLYYITEKEVEKKLQLYKGFFKDKLLLFPNSSKQICDRAIQSSNIVINIANNIPNQLPSKLYEIISLGKPIVNFYTTDNDTSVNALKAYPAKMNIYLNHYDLKEFECFCLKFKDKIIPFSEVEKKYLTSKKVAQIFIDEIKKSN